MYLIITIDPLEQPGCYDITSFRSYDEVKKGIIDIITERIYSDPDYNKINYYKKIIDQNLDRYKEYIDIYLPNIENGDKFCLKYYGYFYNQELINLQYDTMYNIHKVH